MKGDSTLKTRKIAAVMVLCVTMICLSVVPVAPDIDANMHAAKQYLLVLKHYVDDGWIERAVDPDIATRSQVQNMRTDCLRMIECINFLEEKLGKVDSMENLKQLAEFHLQFNQDGDDYQLVELSGNDYEVLAKLRGAIHLPVPKGFAFVNFDRTTDPENEIAPLITAGQPDGDTFDDSQTNTRMTTNPGQTILTRYVIVRSGIIEGGEKRERAVIEHELVHVYTNCVLGIKHRNALPKWFSEGCACYFAGNKPEEVVSTQVTGDSTITKTASLPSDYKEYLKVFEFLARVKGKEAFGEFLTNTLSKKSVDEPLKEFTGATSYIKLVALCNEYKQLTDERIGGIILILLILGLILKLSVGGRSSRYYYDDRFWNKIGIVLASLALIGVGIWVLVLNAHIHNFC